MQIMQLKFNFFKTFLPGHPVNVNVIINEWVNRVL